MSSRRLAVAAVFVIGAVVAAACGQMTPMTTYPDHTINMVVPFAKGGSDSFARNLAYAAGPILGLSDAGITITNVPGADGTTGDEQALNASADGYNLLEGIAGSLILGPIVDGKTNVKWDAFDPVARVQAEEEFMFVKSAYQYQTVDAVVTQAKTAKTAVHFCGSVLAGVDSFVYQFLSKAVPFDGTYDPYSGGGPAQDAFFSTDGGTRCDVLIGSYSDLSDAVSNNMVTPIAVASDTRSTINMNVPTLKEKGWDVVLHEWRGVMAPKGTPTDRINKLADAFQKATATDSWKAFTGNTQSVDFYAGPADFKTFLTSEDQRFSALIQQLGLAADGGP
jgi:putative tricarboxylic transport membrane protein